MKKFVSVLLGLSMMAAIFFYFGEPVKGDFVWGMTWSSIVGSLFAGLAYILYLIRKNYADVRAVVVAAFGYIYFIFWCKYRKCTMLPFGYIYQRTVSYYKKKEAKANG